MSITRQSSDRLAKRLAAVAPEIKAKLVPALIKSAEEVADKARALAEASRRTGETIESITVTAPGGTSPAYAESKKSPQPELTQEEDEAELRALMKQLELQNSPEMDDRPSFD